MLCTFTYVYWSFEYPFSKQRLYSLNRGILKEILASGGRGRRVKLVKIFTPFLIF